MNNKQINDFEDCMTDNDDFFYRDNEMARASLSNIKHQVDPSYNKQKNIKTKEKKQ